MYIRRPMARTPRSHPASTFRVVVVAALSVLWGCPRTPPIGGPAPGGKDLPLLQSRYPAGKFETGFEARLRSADPARRIVALLDLSERLDLRALARDLRKAGLRKAERRAAVIDALERVAARQQERLRPSLDRLVASGEVGFVQSIAIVNRLVVEARPGALLDLASHAEIAQIRPDWTSERAVSRGSAAAGEPRASQPGESFRSWAIDATKADRLWSLGLDGSGVVVAAIDTGALEAHEQLAGRRLPGERGWFDPVLGSSVGTDSHGHGTSVLSQAVGGNPHGRVLGIAPGASWAAALGNLRNFYSRSRMTLAADWVLRVARPDVVVNAWSHDEGRCNTFDRDFIDAWKAAEMFVVFPAGNAGPAPASGESPAELAGVFPGGGPVFSVAGLSPGGTPVPASSRGPSRCGSAAFPMVAAPGAELPFADATGRRAYRFGEGTSLAAGLLGGAAALLLQAEPETDPMTLERVLVASARDVVPVGHDDATGAGAVDLEAALALLRSGTNP